MKKEFRKQFLSNLKGIKDKNLADEIAFILEVVETVERVKAIPGIKKLTGYNDLYRIRVEDYRIGIQLSGKKIIFVCLYHRSVIYEKFP